MKHEAARAALDAAVAEAEKRTDAEILVAVVRASGSYADVDHLAAALAAMVALVAVLACHFHGLALPDHWIVPPIVAAYVAALLAARRTSALRRLLAGSARRERQVRRAARALFVEERLHATRARKGVLLYVSLLERSVLILPDFGIEGRVDGATWNALARELELAARERDQLEPALAKAVSAAGELLARRLPRSAASQDEIARRVLVRP